MVIAKSFTRGLNITSSLLSISYTPIVGCGAPPADGNRKLESPVIEDFCQRGCFWLCNAILRNFAESDGFAKRYFDETLFVQTHSLAQCAPVCSCFL